MIKKAVKNEVFWGLILVNISLACFIDRQIFLADALKSVAEEAVIAFCLKFRQKRKRQKSRE